MAEPDAAILSAVLALIEGRRRDGLFVLGLCGAQGSGKSTLAGAMMRQCGEQGIAAATLSLDDLYLTRAERRRLARDVHPLLATRGVPGTHDVGLGLEVLAALDRGEPALLPRFAKANDDRLPRSEWTTAPRDCQVLLFEGWCVGARPQSEEALLAPVNELEAREDPDATWRRFANVALADDYQRLFARIDALALLAAPNFDVVFDWRLQQEAELQASANADAPGVMDAAAVARFIRHYERLTRHILAEMPTRADLMIELAEDRSPVAIRTAAGRR